MASQQEFASEEWSKLIETPMFASASGLAGAHNSDISLICNGVTALATPEARSIAREKLKHRFSGGSST